MISVFVDTGAWIALSVVRDQSHKPAAAYARTLAATKRLLMTTNYVLIETYTRIRYDDGHTKAIAFDARIDTLQDQQRLIVEWVTPEIHDRALQIFRKYADQAFSMVDCASFVVARNRGIKEVFGFDKNFLTMGFQLRPGGASSPG